MRLFPVLSLQKTVVMRRYTNQRLYGTFQAVGLRAAARVAIRLLELGQKIVRLDQLVEEVVETRRVREEPVTLGQAESSEVSKRAAQLFPDAP